MKFKAILTASVCLLVTGLAVWLYQSHRPGPPEVLTNLAPAAPQIPHTRSLQKRLSTVSSGNPQQTMGSHVSTLVSGLSVVPKSIRPIFGLDGTTNFASRLTAVHGLGKDLKREELEALYAFLKTKNGTDRKSRGGEHVLKNDVMDILLEQMSPPQELADVLMALYQDHEQDSVTRDYALQHLVSYQQRQISDPLPNKERIEKTLWEGLAEIDSSIAGTALLGLHRLSAASPQMTVAGLDDVALKLAQSEEASRLSRITAVRVCAERRLEQARPIVLDLAQSGGDIPLQISAIAALGNLGAADEIGFLERLVSGENEFLKPAARTALQSLKERQTAGGGPTGR